ncbi:speckle-type POZ protein-like [Aphidius gifuensis]|uniref:speckle-type POZ protein-like n=1 Tax=Aphidius gifuensis TaxID=684658 RepID=UPI001CDCD7DA|nr:speckle-type POZ protein-like [Aphidius gifuensis]
MSILGGPQDSVKLIMSKQDYVSGMETCEFQYDWTIKNFVQLWTVGKITSPSFSSKYSNFHDQWIVKLHPDFDNWQDSKYMSVDLQLQTLKNISELSTHCSISINKRNESDHKFVFTKCPETTSWPNYIQTSNLLDSSSRYLQNDELKICITISMSKKKINIDDTKIASSRLTTDLKKILLNEQLSDVTIKVGQRSFRAIKGILGARSPVFAAMFNHEEFKENEKNEVVIEDIEENVFEEFLHYIYTDESPNVDKMPMELLVVAEKYQMDCLKNICEEVICKTINVDNAASMLVCSDRYQLKKLKEKCLEFMKTNLRAVMSNETFQVYKKQYPEVFICVLDLFMP